MINAERLDTGTCAVLAAEVNAIHGFGVKCGKAFSKEDLTPLPGVVSTTAELPDYIIVPAKERWDHMWTAEKIKEALA